MRDEQRALWRAAWAADSRELADHAHELFASLATARAGEPDLRAFSPGPGRWSIDLILEHVALANGFLLLLCRKIADTSARRIARGEPWPAGPPEDRRSGLVALGVTRRSWSCPEHMLPTGELVGVQLAARLDEEERELQRLLADGAEGQGSLHRIRNSLLPEGRDRLDLHGWIEFLLAHVGRHLDQCRRNREAWLGEAPGPAGGHPVN